MCAYECAQLQYTIQHRTVPSYLQTNIIAQTLSIGGEGVIFKKGNEKWKDRRKSRGKGGKKRKEGMGEPLPKINYWLPYGFGFQTEIKLPSSVLLLGVGAGCVLLLIDLLVSIAKY